MTTTQKLAVELEIEIHVPVEKAWAFLASEEGMKSWLGPKTYQPELGGEVLFDVSYETTKYHMIGEIVAFNPPHRLAFTWLQDEVGGERWPVATTVTLTLEPTQNGTLVKLVHSGFEKLPERYRESEFQSYVEGWAVRNVMTALKETLEEKTGK